MDELENLEPRDENLPKGIDVPRPRAVGSPLPKGEPSRTTTTGPLLHSGSMRVTPPVGPPDDGGAEEDLLDDMNQSSSLQRAMKGVRMALPFMQKVLPLLDSQVIGAVANLLTPRSAPAQPVNLGPLETGLADVQTQQRKLREQLSEQNSSLRKVEDRLEMVREATDRNTLEQQELLEDLKSVRRKVAVFATISLILLLASVGLNVVLFLYMRGILK